MMSDVQSRSLQASWNKRADPDLHPEILANTLPNWPTRTPVLQVAINADVGEGEGGCVWAELAW
jgi:hypothetical protein